MINLETVISKYRHKDLGEHYRVFLNDSSSDSYIDIDKQDNDFKFNIESDSGNHSSVSLVALDFVLDLYGEKVKHNE